MAPSFPFRVAEVVDTAWGRARIDAIESTPGTPATIYHCTATKWRLAQDCLPRFHLNAEALSPAQYQVGDQVLCSYGGVGQITAVRGDNDYVITLKSWALATGKSPVLFLNRDAFTHYVVPSEEVGKSSAVAEQVMRERAQAWKSAVAQGVLLKSEATEAFKGGDVVTARDKYLEAYKIMQELGGEDLLPDSVRAEVYEVSTTCMNNVAMCCLRTEQYEQAISFARNGLMLVRAMEGRVGSSVWRELLKRGMTLDKLCKDWKKKSLYLLGKAELKTRDYDEAVEHFEAALALIEADEAYAKNAAELRDLLASTMLLRKKELKRSQKTWSKAFQQSGEEVEKEKEQAASPQPSGQKPAAATVASKTGSSSSSSSSPKPNAKLLDPKAIAESFLKPEPAKDKDPSSDGPSDGGFGWALLGAAAIGAAAILLWQRSRK